MPNQMRPIHPGEILKGEMEEIGLSARQLAMALGVPTNRVTSIVHEARALTADTALRLARYFGTSPEFWLNLQSAYELRRAQQERGARIAQEVVPRADRQCSATRQGGSKGIGGGEDSRKRCVSSSRCASCPATGEPARAGRQPGDGVSNGLGDASTGERAGPGGGGPATSHLPGCREGWMTAKATAPPA
jgi:antitoxin HigA-1